MAQGVQKVSDVAVVNEGQHSALGDSSPQGKDPSVQEEVPSSSVKEGPPGTPTRKLGGDRVTVVRRAAAEHEGGRTLEGVGREAAGPGRRKRVGVGPGGG